MSTDSIVAIDIDENSEGRKGDNAVMDPGLYDNAEQDSIGAFRSQVEQSSSILEQVTQRGNSFLHVAASRGSEEITKYLVRWFPGLITKQNFQGDTALHLAARFGHPSTTKILVEHNSNLLTVTNSKGNTALHDAVINGSEEVVKCLVSKHHEGSYCNKKAGKSPLYLAFEKSSSTNVDHLLGDDGTSVQAGKLDLSRLLQGQSPAHAAVKQKKIELLKKIAAKKPELMWLKDQEKRNPLHLASLIGYVEEVEFLILELGATGATEIDQEGNKPIHLACQGGFLEVVKKFLKTWPYAAESLNQKEQNILHVAAENGQEEVVKYILRAKNLSTLLNETDEDGNTPLHLATEGGKPNIVFALVSDERVDRKVLNNENWTPYDIAENKSQKAVDEYENSDKRADIERQQFDTENVKTEDVTKDKHVCLKHAKDGLKSVTLYDKDKCVVVDPKKQDKKASSKSDKQLNYYGAMTTLSILYFFARPTGTLYERFATQEKPPRKEETQSRIGNLLVAAVLVAGATFAGAIQLPQYLNNSFAVAIAATHNTTSATSSPTGSSLLDAYLCVDALALNTSMMAAIILLWTNLNYIKFAPFAVWFSSLMVGGSIYMMCLAFFSAVSIAVGTSNYGILAITTIGVGSLFFCAQTLLYLQWILPSPINQILEEMLSHYVYFGAFGLFYSWKWVPDKLSAIRRNKAS